jgi:putative solute:sodium symporter small subunit
MAAAVDPDCLSHAVLLQNRMTSSSDFSASTLSEPPPVSAAMARAHRAYWRFNVALIGVLLTIGGVVSFGVPLIAQRVGHVRIAGFPLPFYVGAQGAILVYVALILVYIVLMQFADARLMRVARAQRDAAA